jgi:hypothetical protein
MVRVLTALALLALSPVSQAASLTAENYVLAGPNQWRQLTDTTGFSWNQIASVCSTTTGACSGSLGGVSFDGWIWADNATIRDLFDALIVPASTQFAGPTSDYSNVDDPDIAAVIGPPSTTPGCDIATITNPTPCGLFAMTGATFFFGSDFLYGWSRTLATASTAYLPNLIDGRVAGAVDSATLSFAGDINAAGDVAFPIGVWLYQPATVVPVPAAAWLFAGALTALPLLRRRS